MRFTDRMKLSGSNETVPMVERISVTVLLEGVSAHVVDVPHFDLREKAYNELLEEDGVKGSVAYAVSKLARLMDDKNVTILPSDIVMLHGIDGDILEGSPEWLDEAPYIKAFNTKLPLDELAKRVNALTDENSEVSKSANGAVRF